MDCILIRPPFEHTGFDQDYQESLGTASLAASLRQAGFTVAIIDGELQNLTPEEIVDMIITAAPAVAGFSIMSAAALESAAFIAAEIKRRSSISIHLTAGGYLPSFFPEALEKEIPQLDSICPFEGEATLPLLVESIIQKSSAPVSGVIITGKDINTAPLPAVKVTDLNRLPLPARDMLPAVLKKGLPATISGSRGCSGSCTFCSVVRFSMKACGIPLRQRSPENIILELKNLSNRGVSVVHFIDDDFIGSLPEGLSRARRLARLIIDENLKIIFYLECRPDHIEEKTFTLLKQAGLAGVFLGIDSAVERTRLLYNKESSMDQVEAALSVLKRLSIHTDTGFIPLHPFASLEDIEEEYNFLFRHNLDTLHTLLNRFYSTPESPLSRRLLASGLLTPQDDFEYKWTFSDPRTSLYFETASTALKPLFPRWYSLYRKTYTERNQNMISGTDSSACQNMLSSINSDIRDAALEIINFVKEERADDLLSFTRSIRRRLSENFSFYEKEDNDE